MSGMDLDDYLSTLKIHAPQRVLGMSRGVTSLCGELGSRDGIADESRPDVVTCDKCKQLREKGR